MADIRPSTEIELELQDYIGSAYSTKVEVTEIEDGHTVSITSRKASGIVTDEFDVTGDGNLDLCRYDGGRASTSLSIGKIEGWHLLDRELENVATITRDADGGYIITPIEAA